MNCAAEVNSGRARCGGHSVLCPYQRTLWPTRNIHEAGSKQRGIKFFGWWGNLDIMGRIRSFGQSVLLMSLRKCDGLAGQG